MTYEKIFSDIQKNFKKARISDFTGEFAFQFNITGEGEGIFYVAYKNGFLSIEPYDYKDRDVIFTADGKTFIAISSGKLEPIDAINGGKLFVDGNQELAKELMLLISHEKKTETKAAAKTAAEKSPAEKKETKPEAKETKKEEEKPNVPEITQDVKPVKTEIAAKTEEKPAEAPKVPEAVKTPEEKKNTAPVSAAPKPAAKAPAKAKSKKSKRK